MFHFLMKADCCMKVYVTSAYHGNFEQNDSMCIYTYVLPATRAPVTQFLPTKNVVANLMSLCCSTVAAISCYMHALFQNISVHLLSPIFSLYHPPHSMLSSIHYCTYANTRYTKQIKSKNRSMVELFT